MIDDICLSYKGNLLTNEGVRIEFFRMKELWSTQNIPPRKSSSSSFIVPSAGLSNRGV